MAEDGRLIRVGVCWDDLAASPEQLGRIAAASRADPIIWDGEGPAPDVEVLIADNVPDVIPREVPHLRLLQLISAGVDQLREHPVWRSDVAIATAAGVHGVQIAEHVLMLLLALRRHLPSYLEAQRCHEWTHDRPAEGELYGLTLGLIGYGHIGRGVAHLARAFGMRVLATSASVHEAAPLVIPGASPFVDPPAVPLPGQVPDQLLPLTRLDDLLAQSDALVICAALTPQTTGMIDANALAHMKHGSYLVNIARGKIVEEAALVQALRDGRLAGAGLDVTEDEPLPSDHPLWELPNVIITPHISGKTSHYVERTVNVLLANLDRLRRGEAPLTAVDRRRSY
jgi:phosphoglycerate dehydrogenase-like enzyme